ncbi:MAG TPA: ParA family protein [Desulfonatronum sp.]|nr:ParA family protein [Desulfonatronum sp.]
MRIISFANHKGGVGKTTTVVNTAFAFSRMGRRVLVVDMDPQGNATLTLGGVDPFEHDQTIGHLLADKDLGIADCALAVSDTLFLVPANLDTYEQLALLPPNSAKRIFGLREKMDLLRQGEDRYDFVFVDCPPQIEGPLVINAVAASDAYVLPVDGESLYALQGTNHLMQAIEAIREDTNSGIRLLGVLVTMVNPRTTASRLVMRAVRDFFGNAVFKTTIRRNTTLNKANLSRRYICDLDPASYGCKDYQGFAGEMLGRLDAERGP